MIQVVTEPAEVEEGQADVLPGVSSAEKTGCRVLHVLEPSGGLLEAVTRQEPHVGVESTHTCKMV